MTFGLVMWGMNVGYAAMVVLADHCAFEFLILVRRHANLRVLGEGYITTLISLILILVCVQGSVAGPTSVLFIG